MAQLDRRSTVALHAQLSAILAAEIRDGVHPTGTRLPGELELAATHGIARSVVRQALASLAAMGLIERVKGSGSRVTSSTRFHRLAQSRMGLASQLAGVGSVVTTQILAFERSDEPRDEFGSEATGTLLLERLRSVDGQPVAFIRTWLPLPLVDSLTPEVLVDASLHEAMASRYGTDFVGGTRQVRALAATQRLADMLSVTPGDPVLLLEGITFDAAGRVVEKFATWHRADLITLDFTL